MDLKVLLVDASKMILNHIIGGLWRLMQLFLDLLGLVWSFFVSGGT